MAGHVLVGMWEGIGRILGAYTVAWRLADDVVIWHLLPVDEPLTHVEVVRVVLLAVEYESPGS